MKILNITLERDYNINALDEKAVTGKLTIHYKNNKNEYRKQTLRTIENVDYLLDKGIYPMKMEYSPKFKRQLWELMETQPRTEIKFHIGYESKHSKGCILMNPRHLQTLHYTLDSTRIYYLTIKN